MKEIYEQQVSLLLDILPLVSNSEVFALKGGTAINLFLRNMPRLSVDIDLTYLPNESRGVALEKINDELIGIMQAIRDFDTTLDVRESRTKKDQVINKIFISNGAIQIKIEPNHVLRGSVFTARKQVLCEAAQHKFEKFVETNMLSLPDIYAGKICAALDRQHPRDLFDIKLLLENEGVTDEIRQAFVVYLASHSRPVSELLDPNDLDIKELYQNEFVDMTFVSVTYDDLVQTRETLKSLVRAKLTNNERQFLLSIKSCQPNWSLMNLPDIQDLPAIKWKLFNLKQMDQAKHKAALEKLRNILEV